MHHQETSADEPSLLPELDEAIAALQRALASGVRVHDSPLRTSGLEIMKFPKGKEANYRLHAELLRELAETGLLKQYSVWKVDLPKATDVCGVIAVLGSAADVVTYGKTTYYLPAAEEFVARACENNWSKIDAASTASDTPRPGMGLDVAGAEKDFASIRGYVAAHPEGIHKIG